MTSSLSAIAFALSLAAATGCSSKLTCPVGNYEDDAGYCRCNPGTVLSDKFECVPADAGSSADAATVQRDAGTDARTTPSMQVGVYDAGETEADASGAAAPADAAVDAGAMVDAEMTRDAAAADAAVFGGNSSDGGAERNVILALSSHQPPSTIPQGSWPAQMRNGHFRFSWTPNFPSTAITDEADGDVALFQFGGVGDTSDGIYLDQQGTACKIWLQWGTGGGVSMDSLVFSAGQRIEYEIDLPRRTWTVRGATSGNGTISIGTAVSWPDGTLYVGRSGRDGYELYRGTISDIEGLP